MSTSNDRPVHAPGSSQTPSKTVPFAQLPHGLMADRRLHPIDKIVASALLHHAWNDNDCTASDGTLGDYADTTRFTVQRSLANLEAHGYIRREDAPGKTGRKIVISWRSEPEIIPPAPPTSHKDRAGSSVLKLHQERPIRRSRKVGPVAPVQQQSGLEADQTCCTDATPPVASVQQQPVAPVQHKEKGIQEFEESLSSQLVSPRNDGVASQGSREPKGRSKRKAEIAEATPGIEHDPEAVEAATNSVRCLIESYTTRTQKDVANLIAECGPEIVMLAVSEARLKRDFPPYLKGNALRYMYAVARKMKAEGGPQSVPIGCRNPLDDPNAPPGSWNNRPIPRPAPKPETSPPVKYADIAEIWS